jgi:hypothetical protein
MSAPGKRGIAIAEAPACPTSSIHMLFDPYRCCIGGHDEGARPMWQWVRAWKAISMINITIMRKVP